MQRELDSRTTPDGATISLLWDDRAGGVEVVLRDPRGFTRSAPVPRGQAALALADPLAFVEPPGSVMCTLASAQQIAAMTHPSQARFGAPERLGQG